MRYYRETNTGVLIDFAAYRRQLECDRQRLPAGVQAFVFCDWYHNPKDPRCPHDAWLENVSIAELSAGNRSEVRSGQIQATFLGAYHDGFFELTYLAIHSYSLRLSQNFARDPKVSHGDWLYDEIVVEENGVSHDILFSNAGRWTIKCDDIHYRWLPKGTR